MKIVVHAGGIGFMTIDLERVPYEIHDADMITFMIDEGSLLVSMYHKHELDDPFMWATYAPNTWTQVRLLERPDGAVIEESRRTRIRRQLEDRDLANTIMSEMDDQRDASRNPELKPHI
jgi:hypothetical protein